MFKWFYIKLHAIIRILTSKRNWPLCVSKLEYAHRSRRR